MLQLTVYMSMEAIVFIISILDKGRNNWHYCVNLYKDYIYVCEIVYILLSALIAEKLFFIIF